MRTLCDNARICGIKSGYKYSTFRVNLCTNYIQIFSCKNSQHKLFFGKNVADDKGNFVQFTHNGQRAGWSVGLLYFSQSLYQDYISVMRDVLCIKYGSGHRR